MRNEPKSVIIRCAYTVVYEDRTEMTGERGGWYVGLAKENEPGYHQLRPGYGLYPDEKACRASVNDMNAKLGLTLREAIEIIASSMREQWSTATARHNREC